MEIKEIEKKDFSDINKLYNEVYKGYYPLPETYNKKIFDEVVDDDSHFWLVAEEEGKPVASLIMVGSRKRGVCKCYGAAIRKDFQAKGIVYTLHKEAEKMAKYPIYYAIARMNVVTPQKLLRKLDFYPLGIFPNAMRVKDVETHGLFVSYRGDMLKERKRPVIIEPIREIYDCARDVLNLDAADTVPLIREEHPRNPVDFRINTSPTVRWEWADYRGQEVLIMDYFPFFEPNMKLYSEDMTSEVFIHYSPTSAHMYVLGIKSENDLREVFEGISNVALSFGCYYIELVAPTSSPDLQSAMYLSDFLPSAYFPAFKKARTFREDCFIACKLLLPPQFGNVHVDDMNKNFLRAYCDIYTEKIRREVYGWSDRRSH